MLVATWLPQSTRTRGKLGPKVAQNLHKYNAKLKKQEQNLHKHNAKLKNKARTTTTNNRVQGSSACSHLAATRTRGKLRPNNTKKTTRTTTNKQQKRQQKTTVLVCRPHLLRRRLIESYQLTRMRDVMMKVFS